MSLTTSPVEGGELIRMTRPKDWDHMQWCQEADCESINRHGQRVPCPSVYGFQETGAATMIGWRAACSRKHALAIWRRELEVPA